MMQGNNNNLDIKQQRVHFIDKNGHVAVLVSLSEHIIAICSYFSIK